MTLKEKIFNGMSISKDNVKGKILSRSLLWMGIGLAAIVLVAYLTSTFSIFEDFMLRISSGNNWFAIFVLNLVLILGLAFTINNNRVPIIIPASLYVLFALFEGIFISSVLYYSNSLSMSNLLLLMLIPSGIFGLMGMIAYFNLFDFSKLLPFLIMGSLMLIILGITLIFFNNSTLEKVYLFLSALIFIVWVGFDIQMIKRAEERFSMMDSTLDDKEMKTQINRLSLTFGITLFIDFVRLLWIVISFFNRD